MMLPITIFSLFQTFVVVVLHPLQIHIWSSFSHVHILEALYHYKLFFGK